MGTLGLSGLTLRISRQTKYCCVDQHSACYLCNLRFQFCHSGHPSRITRGHGFIHQRCATLGNFSSCSRCTPSCTPPSKMGRDRMLLCKMDSASSIMAGRAPTSIRLSPSKCPAQTRQCHLELPSYNTLGTKSHLVLGVTCPFPSFLGSSVLLNLFCYCVMPIFGH